MTKWERNVLLLIARTALRCERLLLDMARDKTFNETMAYCDECVRLDGYANEHPAPARRPHRQVMLDRSAALRMGRARHTHQRTCDNYLGR